MSASYLFQARKALDTALKEIAFPDAAARARVEKDVFLRPPKQESFGDLSTNIAIILKSIESMSFEDVSPPFLAAFRTLEGIAEVRLAETAYINLIYASTYWQSNLPVICREREYFGLEGEEGAAVTLAEPAAINDLASARKQANAEALGTLAELCGRATNKETLPARAPEGFPLAAAIAKCTAIKTRFALLANPPGFMDAFSPILAIDRAYNNPVFAIPYALSQVKKLRARAGTGDVKEGAGVEMSVLNLPIELKLAKALSGWPVAVTRALGKADVFYLVSFLEEVSLLFFRAFDALRPLSSDYLSEPGKGSARLVLLAAVEQILSGGLTVLGVTNVKEYA